MLTGKSRHDALKYANVDRTQLHSCRIAHRLELHRTAVYGIVRVVLFIDSINMPRILR